MKKLLLVLLVAVLAVPVHAAVFKVSADGGFDTYRGSGPEGYVNGGNAGFPRIAKGNQAMGWMSFKNSTEATSGQSLATFLAATPGATATLYVRSGSAGTKLGTTTMQMVSIRSGNQGDLLEDGTTSSSGYTNATAGIGAMVTGKTGLFAWRMASPPSPLTTYPNWGNGLYVQDDPASTAGTQGEPWITPSTRAANTGMTPWKVGANAMVRYDTGILGFDSGTGLPTGTATGKYRGWFPDTTQGGGRQIFALEDVLGFHTNKGNGHTDAHITAAGQIINGGVGASKTIVNQSMYVAADPLTGTDNWLAIPVDAAFLADMVTAENKGFVFDNYFSGAGAVVGNPDFYSKEQAGGAFASYMIVTPEPATMILLALGGLVALRRRAV